MSKVKDYYDFIDEYAPFSTRDKFDNVGMLVGDMNIAVKGVCICLDITNDVINEAVKRKANLIISHHPVIFDPLKNVVAGTPVYNLIRNKISVICAHTNADMAKNGVTDIMLEFLDFTSTGETLEVVYPDGTGYGKICKLSIATDAVSLAEHCKKAFGCEVVRFCDGKKPIERVAVCSGSGGSNLDLSIAKNCDALITGDIKHDVWISAKNQEFTLIDAGHFYTENILCHYLVGELSRKFHSDSIFVAQNSVDPCEYIK